MNWLDLGWLSRGDAWEFHPWGPLARGYLLRDEAARSAMVKTRWIRAGVLVAVLLLAALRIKIGSWWPVLALAVVGTGVEALVTWWVLRGSERTDQPLGWDAGMLYLAKWLGPKLLTVARMLVLGLVALSLVGLWRQPTALLSYLLLAFFLGVQFLLLYLEQVERGSGR